MTTSIMPCMSSPPVKRTLTTKTLPISLKNARARALAEGFVYQGEVSVQSGEKRGVDSTGQPPVAFVDFIQNHDQVGNRAQGERLISLAGAERTQVLLATLLLSPHIPLLFMGKSMAKPTLSCSLPIFMAIWLKPCVKAGQKSLKAMPVMRAKACPIKRRSDVCAFKAGLAQAGK